MEKEKINWDISEYCLRIAVVELCGWATKKGHATAAKRILTKHGIEK